MSKITKVAGIDFDTVVFRQALRLQGDTFDIDPEYETVITNDQIEEAYEAIEAELKTIMFNTKCTEYIVFLTGSTNFRYNILPSYKWRRKNSPRPIALQELKDLCLARLNCVLQEDVEADDTSIMWFTHDESEAGIRKVLCHVDKDLDQVAGQHYNYDKDLHYTVTQEDADAFLWLQVLAGDTADCYKGCPNVGNERPKGKPDEHSKAERIVYGTLCTKPVIKRFTRGAKAGMSEIKWEDYHDNTLDVKERVLLWYIKGYVTKGGQGHVLGFNTTSGYEDNVTIKESDLLFDINDNYLGVKKGALDFVKEEMNIQYLVARMLRYGDSIPQSYTQL